MSAALKQLDAEWRRVARSPASRRALIRWQSTHPALAGLTDLGDLLARRKNNPHTAPEVLAALAALAPSDDLAARTLLQALMPGLIHLSITAAYDDPEALDHLIPLAWERIRTYPSSRTGDVAGNVLLDVRKRYRRYWEIESPRKRHQRDWQATNGDSDEAVAERTASVPSAEDTVLERLVLDELLAARRDGIISDTALRLIVQTRVLDTTVSEIAESTGINRNTLMSWRFRAERRLRELRLAG